MADLNLKILIKAIDGVTAPVKAMNRQIESMTKPFAAVGKAVKNLSAQAGIPQVASAIGGVGTAARGVAGEIGRLALKAGGLAAGFAFLFQRTTETGDQFAKMSQRFGAPVETLSRYAHGAELAGASTQDLGAGLKFLSRRAVDAARGGKESQFWFRSLGIQVKDASGKMKDSDQIFREVADRFQGMEDGAQKSAVATALFKGAGEALTPLLNEGSEGLKKYADEADRLNLTWKEGDARSAEAFNDALSNLHGSITGVWKTIVTNLAPALTPIIQSLTDWVVKNRALIAVNVTAFLKDFAAAAKDVWGKLQMVWGVMKPWIDLIGPGNAALAILAVTVGGPLVVSLLSLIGAVKALGIALLTTPLGWFMLALAPLLFAVGKLVIGLVGMRATWAEVWGAMKEIASLAIEGLIDWIKTLWGWISKIVDPLGLISGGFKAAGNFAAGAFAGGAQPAPALARTQVGGQINVGFRNAPPGMQVEGIRRQGPVGLSAETGVMFP